MQHVCWLLPVIFFFFFGKLTSFLFPIQAKKEKKRKKERKKAFFLLQAGEEQYSLFSTDIRKLYKLLSLYLKLQYSPIYTFLKYQQERSIYL
jgi:hypothetical protein